MGAWIETRTLHRACMRRPGLHPSWVRGLKLDSNHDLIACRCVAPFMGAWIETLP